MTIAAPTRQQALATLTAELAAFQRLVATLNDGDWSRPTASAGWTVRDLVAHVAGQFEEQARFGTFRRRLREAKRRYPDRIALDAHNQFQIDELAGLPTAELTAHLARHVPLALTAIRRTPGLVRRLPSTLFFPEPPLPDRRMSYLFDILTSRDTWMHRLEIADATGRPFTVDDHDTAVVEQVVRDLARAWTGPAIKLELTGTISGGWSLGSNGKPESVDGLVLMRHLSGRGGLEPGHPLGNARVVF
jgi:uncharacterized protein (TIGR03083 family)